MSVNLLRCTASPWTGDPEVCRWCGVLPVRHSNRFCSRECLVGYRDDHLYARAKYVVLEASRAPCPCPPGRTIKKRWYDPQSDRVVYDEIPPPHRHCSSCGRCEAQLHAVEDRLTVNHIVPRMGLQFGELNCIHHQDNLEPLCWTEHEALNRILNARLKRERDKLIRTTGQTISCYDLT